MYHENERGEILVGDKVVGTGLRPSGESCFAFTSLSGGTRFAGRGLVTRHGASAPGAERSGLDRQRFARDLELADRIGTEARRLRVGGKIVSELMREKPNDLAAVLAALPAYSMSAIARGWWARRSTDGATARATSPPASGGFDALADAHWTRARAANAAQPE